MTSLIGILIAVNLIQMDTDSNYIAISADWQESIIGQSCDQNLSQQRKNS